MSIPGFSSPWLGAYCPGAASGGQVASVIFPAFLVDSQQKQNTLSRQPFWHISTAPSTGIQASCFSCLQPHVRLTLCSSSCFSPQSSLFLTVLLSLPPVFILVPYLLSTLRLLLLPCIYFFTLIRRRDCVFHNTSSDDRGIFIIE